MTIFHGPMSYHIDGHKELTEHGDILKIETDVIEMSMLVGNHKASCCVKVGDHVRIGDILGKRDDHFYVPILSPCSGEVISIKEKISSANTMVECVCIANDHKEEKKEIRKITTECDPEDIISYIKEIGLVGQGGAGFPAYIKYNTDACETLIINAVECEPYITADIANIEKNKELFELGVRLLFKASKAKQCIIGIKQTHSQLIEELKGMFEEPIRVMPLKDVYPMGWERTLVYEVLHRRYNKLPIEVGAIVSNATSAVTLGYAAKNGYIADSRIITVSGECIKEPHNVECKLGTPIKLLLDACGGIEKEDVNLTLGGPMMGKTVESDEVSVTMVTNAVTVYENKNREALECLKCCSCIDHCPSSLKPMVVRKMVLNKKVDKLKGFQVSDCVECGLCSYMCPSKIALTDIMREAKRLVSGG